MKKKHLYFRCRTLTELKFIWKCFLVPGMFWPNFWKLAYSFVVFNYNCQRSNGDHPYYIEKCWLNVNTFSFIWNHSARTLDEKSAKPIVFFLTACLTFCFFSKLNSRWSGGYFCDKLKKSFNISKYILMDIEILCL